MQFQQLSIDQQFTHGENIFRKVVNTYNFRLEINAIDMLNDELWFFEPEDEVKEL